MAKKFSILNFLMQAIARVIRKLNYELLASRFQVIKPLTTCIQGFIKIVPCITKISYTDFPAVYDLHFVYLVAVHVIMSLLMLEVLSQRTLLARYIKWLMAVKGVRE